MIRVFLYLFFIIAINTQTCEECVTTDSEGPVCGNDGRTYLSECFADCARVQVWFEGRCPRHNCPQLYYPVCAVSGRTYMNECEANFYQDSIVSFGYCGRAPLTNLVPNVRFVRVVPSPVRLPYQWP